MYLRFYQKFMRTPGPARHRQPAVDAVQRHVAHQDRRVVQTQLPKRSDLRMGEKLIPGDGPIIAYRRRRQELIEAAEGWKLETGSGELTSVEQQSATSFQYPASALTPPSARAGWRPPAGPR